jgi:hypothetical protein
MTKCGREKSQNSPVNEDNDHFPRRNFEQQPQILLKFSESSAEKSLDIGGS